MRYLLRQALPKNVVVLICRTQTKQSRKAQTPRRPAHSQENHWQAQHGRGGGPGRPDSALAAHRARAANVPREQQTPEALGALVTEAAEKWSSIIKELGMRRTR
jgi:hypothetical protein